ADIGRHTSEEQVGNTGSAQHQFQIRCVECAEPGFINDGLAGQWCQLMDYGMPELATDQQPTQRSNTANRGSGARGSPPFDAGEVGEVRAVSFPGMEYPHAEASGSQ